MEEMRKDILTAGLSVTLTCDSRKNLFTSDFVFNDVIKKYGISDNRGLRMIIKVEVNKPRWELISESMVLSMYGYNFTAILMSKGNLLSEKTCAPGILREAGNVPAICFFASDLHQNCGIDKRREFLLE